MKIVVMNSIVSLIAQNAISINIGYSYHFLHPNVLVNLAGMIQELKNVNNVIIHGLLFNL